MLLGRHSMLVAETARHSEGVGLQALNTLAVVARLGCEPPWSEGRWHSPVQRLSVDGRQLVNERIGLI